MTHWPATKQIFNTIDFSWKQSWKCDLDISDYDHNITLRDEEDKKECEHVYPNPFATIVLSLATTIT